MSDAQVFEFKSEDGVEYRLHVTGRGFTLYDVKTDEPLIDASMLIDNHKRLYPWPVEILASDTNREFYFSYVPYKDYKIQFGIGRRK